MKRIAILLSFILFSIGLNAQYPISYGEEPTYEHIIRVQLSTLDNSSGPTQYSDYTDENMVAGLIKGKTYTISVTGRITDGNPWRECIVVWIDFNGDYDFTDPGEEILSQSGRVSGDFTFSATFTVPSSAIQGNTRMRVSLKYIGYSWWAQCPTSDEIFRWGEVEDYRVAIDVPAIITLPVTNITASTAESGGNILSQDNSAITERGICWATTKNPTINDNIAIDENTGTGIYNLLMSGLTSGQTYYVRAYAKNADGISYGQNETFSIYNIHYVSKYGDDVNGDGSISNPWLTVNNAVAKSVAGDIIIVMDTVIDNNINIDKNLTIQGMNGPSGSVVQASQTFDKNLNARVFYISQNINVTIKDLTIKYGHIDGHGGGIFIDQGANANIEHCVIDSNFATSKNNYVYGGGILVNTDAYLNLSKSEIAYNFADNGGGAIYFVNNASGHIDNSTVAYNTVIYGNGGGVWAEADLLVELINTTIAQNSASDSGGGVYGRTSPSLLHIGNTIIANNSSGTGNDIDGNFYSLDYNIIANNGANITGGTVNNSHFGVNPNLDAFGYYNSDTRTFKPLPISIAVDNGSDALATQTDQRGKYRLKTADIGAHEYLGTDTYIWDGQGGTGSWFDISLWSGNFLPTDITTATVRNGTCNVDNSEGQVKTLYIENTATLNIISPDTLTVNGNYYSKSPNYITGDGILYFNGGIQQTQYMQGKTGNTLIENIYSVKVDSLADIAGNLYLSKGTFDIDSAHIIFRNQIVNNGGRLVGSATAYITIDELNPTVDSFAIDMPNIYKLSVNRTKGAYFKSPCSIIDTLWLKNGLLRLTDTITLEGLILYQGGNLKGNDSAVVYVNGTSDTLELQNIELARLYVNRVKGVKISVDDTLTIDSLLSLTGPLFMKGGDLLIRGGMTGTDSLAAHPNSDLIVNSDSTITLAFRNGFRTLDTLIINSANANVLLSTPLITNNYLDINTGQFSIAPQSYLTNLGSTHIGVNGIFILQSSATSTASFIDNGTIIQEGTAVVQRYAKGGDYHYISAPMSTVPSSQIDGFEANANPNFYSYDETAQSTWNGGNHDDISGWTYPPVLNNGNLEITRGYAVQYPYNVIYNMSGGVLNTGNITSINISYTDYADIDPIYEGWNLVGNPYPSKIDANSFLNANSSVIEGAVYLWDEPADNVYTSSDYAVWSPTGAVAGGGGKLPDGLIDVGQGFFVKAKSGITSANLTFNNSMRVNTISNSFFKSKSVDYPQFKLDLVKSDSSLINRIAIVDMPLASIGKDKYDITKIEGNYNIALYSLIDSLHLIIEALPISNDTVTIPLGYFISSAGDFYFSIYSLENMDNLYEIYLKDNFTGNVVNIKKQNYYFTSDAGRFNNRFELLLYKHPVRTTYWIAGKQGDWNNSANWTNGVPDQYSIAYIESGEVIVNQKDTNYKLIIKPEAKLILNDTLTSVKDVEFEQNGFSAPIIDNPKFLNGQVNYNMILPKQREYLISLPTPQLNNDIETEYYFRNQWFKGQDNIYKSYKVLAPYDNYVLNFTGNLNKDDYIVDVYSNFTNYLANPYLGYYDIYKTGLDKIAKDFYVISANDTSRYFNYGVFNLKAGIGINGANNYLKPLQSFWVNAIQYGQINFIADSLENMQIITRPQDYLLLTVSYKDYADQTALVINSNSSSGYDDYDSEKKFADALYPQVYFNVADRPIAINTIPKIFEGLEIPIIIDYKQQGIYTLLFSLNGAVNDYDIYLTDLTTEEAILVRSDSIINIGIDNPGVKNYKLSFVAKQTVSTNLSQDGKIAQPKIYANNHNIYIETSFKDEYKVELYDINGRLIYSNKYQNNRTIINVDKNLNGIFIVKLKHLSAIYSKPIVIF